MAVYVAMFSAGVACGGFLFAVVSYFLTQGASIAEQTSRIVLVGGGGTCELHNLSESPVTDLEFYFGDDGPLDTEDGRNFVVAGGNTKCDLPTDTEDINSVWVEFVGAKGLRWKRYADGRTELVENGARGVAIRLTTWPWFDRKIRQH